MAKAPPKNPTTPNSNSKSEAGASSGASSSVAAELESLPTRDVLQNAMLSFVDALEKNKAIVSGVVLLAMLGGLGYVGWDLYSVKKEKSAQEALYEVEKPFSDRREKYDQAKFAALSAAAGQDVKVADLVKAGTAVIASGDLTKDYGNLIDDLEAFAKRYVGTAAGVQAALMAAETRLQYQQADQALATLEVSVQGTKANTLIGALSRMAIGNAQAASGKCDLALKSWESVLASKEQAFLHSEAALRAGLCLEKSGDKAKAQEMYRKASSESEKSSAAQTARSLLRALELGT